MDHPIKRDHARFRKIVKGRIRENLRKYVSKGEMPSPKGDGTFKIPMPSIDSPRLNLEIEIKGEWDKVMAKREILLMVKMVNEAWRR